MQNARFGTKITPQRLCQSEDLVWDPVLVEE
jgi:hypothetical protein